MLESPRAHHKKNELNQSLKISIFSEISVGYSGLPWTPLNLLGLIWIKKKGYNRNL